MEFKRCKTCCMPNTRPDTPFIDGECQACINYRNRPAIDWDARKEELIKLLDRHNGKVIVPSSGGKDSSFQCLYLKSLGADVTAVTARTCHLTPIGRANIDNLARHVRTIEIVPNMEVRAKLNRLGLELVGDPSWPEHAAIFSTPFCVARDIGVPLICFGENPQDAYGGPIGTEKAKQMTQRWLHEFGGFLGLRPSDFVDVDGITRRDMDDYEPITADEIKKSGVEAHFLGSYIPWDSHRNAEVAIKNGMQCRLPCEANWWVAENQDNLDTFWHDHGMYRKYGYGRLCMQISVDVRRGLITRDEAMDVVRSRDGIMVDEYMGLSVWDSVERWGMEKDQLFKFLDQFTNWDIFRRVEDRADAPPIRIV